MKRRAYDNWPVAQLGLRTGAQLVDQAIILTGTAMALAFIYPEKMATAEWWVLLFFIWPLVSLSIQCLFVYFTSTTPGKKAFGLKIANAKPHQKLSPWQVLSRQCLWWLGALSLGVGWTTILTRQDRRAWHDLVSETYVATAKTEKVVTGPVTLWQKTLGHSWAVTVSLVFFSFLSAVILFEFQKFNAREAAAATADGPNQKALPTLDEATWLVFTEQFEQTPVRFANLEEERLSEQIKLFLRAQHIPRYERFNFYKDKMQKNEDYLCRASQANSPTCLSAQALSTILSGIESKSAKLDGVYPALKIMYKAEHTTNFVVKTQLLQAELSHVAPTSLAFLALKTYLIKIHSQKGEFEKAASYAGPTSLPQTEDPVADLLTSKYYEYSCQAIGFKGCDTSAVEFCADSKFWQEWNLGCLQNEFEKLDSNAAKLGFVWNKLLKSKIATEEWQGHKAAIKDIDGQGPSLELQIYNALDFAISLKTSEPVNLVEKSKMLNMENPLWGWSQKMAAKEFGGQWYALISKPEQYMAMQYGLMKMEKVVPEKRMLASTKKPASKSSKKKKKKSNY